MSSILVSYAIFYAAAVSTVQPFGMPLVPVFHDVMFAALTNVPVDATLLVQELKHEFADMLVARHFI